MRLALAASVLLVLAGLGAFALSTRMARHAPAALPAGASAVTVTVTVHEDRCDPMAITVPAGRTAFSIVNQSGRVVEWEILDGVMVLEERENIAPGFTQKLTARLPPGKFQITCGLLSNPRGTLTVTPSAESARDAAKPPVASFVGPLAEYRVYTVLESGAAVAATQALAHAVAAGDLAQARAQYGPAHDAYAHIAPAAGLFADLDNRIDARAEYFDKREADPGFAGFQRLAGAIFQRGDLQNQAAVAAALLADVQALQSRLRALQMAPDRLGAIAQRRARTLADRPPTAGAMAAADSLPAQLAGVRKIVEVLRPLLDQGQPALLAELDADFTALASTTDAPKTSALLQTLAQHLGRINPGLGLE